MRILRLAKPFWRTLGVLAILIVTMSGLKQIEPIIAQQLTDQLIGQLSAGKESASSLVVLLGVLLVTRLIITVLNRISWYISSLTTQKLSAHLRQTGFDHLMTLSLGYYHKSISGKMMSQLDRGVNRVTSVINNSGMHFVPAMITAIISVVLVMRYSAVLGIFAVLSFVPFSVINWLRFKKNEKLEKREHKLYDTQYAHFWETISSIELIKSFMAENFESRRLRSFNKTLVSIRKKMEHNNNIGSVGNVILDTWMWGLYAYTVYLAYTQSITVGTMVLLVGYIQLIRQPLWELNWIYWEVRRAQLGAKEFFEILDATPDITDPENPAKLDWAHGRITFDGVEFNYDKGKQVFNDLSFTIKPGEMVALVGPSGAGKTTIASLLMRFFDPTSGKILLDGIDIRNLTRKSLRKNVGIVMQEAQLFADTIEENLRYGNPKASTKELEQAARIANAHEFILEMDKGYKTEIGERGVKLSGGQKQRLSIARTVLKNPPVIILDEATSALDSHSEMLIQQSLEILLKGRTSIVIAHRLSTIAKADKIIVLKDQGILEQGSHAELLKKKGLYASLFNIQAGNAQALKEWDLVA
jgi:ABC-type multidrug transport system fused ATPase/permease subunit